MKKLLFGAAAALCLAACNSKLGPEYTTPAEFGEVNFYPKAEKITSETSVTVEVPVQSLYGFSVIYIVYMLNDDTSDVKNTAPKYLNKEITSHTYIGTIPKCKAGDKVTFQVCAITYYKVPSYSPVYSYTVAAGEEEGGDETPEQPI